MTVGVSARNLSGRWGLTLLSVGAFTVGTDLFVLNGLLPTIAADLHVSEPVAGQLTTIFAVTYAVSSPLLAAFTGRWDRRWLLGGGLALFVLGMLGQAFGPGFVVVAVARVFAAVGAAAFQSNAFAVAGATATDDQRGRALALVATGANVSSVLGVPIGVFAGQWIGWRAVLAAIGGAGLIVAVAIPLLPRVTLPSAPLRTRLSVMIRPAVARVLVVTGLGMLAVFAVFVYLPVVVAPSASAGWVPWVFAGFGIGQVSGNALAGRWTDRRGPGVVRVVSLSGVAAALAIFDGAVQSLPTTMVATIIAGVFSGMLMVPQQHRLFSVAPDAPTVALGLNGSAIYAGGGLGSAVGGLTLAIGGTPWLPPVAAALALAALLVAVSG